jgi:hypothetical protein
MVSVVPKANVGVTFGFTVTVNVVVVAHWPASGVNVYVPPVVLLTIAGLHVPVIPSVDEFGSVWAAAPEQIVELVPKLNVGVIFGFTVTVNVAVVAHWLPLGVNVYVPDVVLLTTAGLQVPLIPFVDVFGSTGTDPLPQIVRLVPNVNVGTVRGVTVTEIVRGILH